MSGCASVDRGCWTHLPINPPIKNERSLFQINPNPCSCVEIRSFKDLLLFLIFVTQALLRAPWVQHGLLHCILPNENVEVRIVTKASQTNVKRSKIKPFCSRTRYFTTQTTVTVRSFKKLRLPDDGKAIYLSETC